MLLLPFLNHRQTGAKSIKSFNASDYKLNLDHVLSRFVCSEKDALTIESEDTPVPPFACQFRKDITSDIVAIASEEGDIFIYDAYDGAKYLHSFAAHHNAIFDICWSPNKNQLLTVSGDFSAALWDMNLCSLISSFVYHTASVRSVDICHEQSAVFATGSRDGNISIWDSRENRTTFEKPSIFIKNAHCRKRSLSNFSKKKSCYTDTTSSVSSVAFQDNKYLASAGVADGVIKVWDLRKTYVFSSKFTPSPPYQINYTKSGSAQGCTSLVFDSSYKKLYACSTSGKIFQLDSHNYSENVVTYEGFSCATYFVKMALSPDDQYLLSGSSDNKAYIWKVSKPGYPMLELPGHLEEVTSVAWNPHNIGKLATCGDDAKVLIWKFGSEESNTNNFSSCAAYSANASSKPCSSPEIYVNKSTPVQNVESNKKTNSVILFGKKTSPTTPESVKKSAIRTITSFFSPVTPSGPSQNPISSKNFGEQMTENFSSPCLKKPISPLVLSPSKVLNKDNIMSDSTNTNKGNTSGINKNSSISSSLDLTMQVKNKENIQENSETSSHILKPLGQTKRKLLPNQTTSTSKCRKILDENSNKAKGHNKKVKKENFSVQSIKNYFTSS